MKRLCLFALFIVCTLLGSMVYALGVQADLEDNLLRMHIVANSNSPVDQNIKLAVRDEILKNMDAKSTTGDIENTANSALTALGVPYTATAQTEKCYVPEKEYKSIRLPEGIYNCIKVVLGDGDGENWWCVAYPPLCFTEEVFGELTPEGKALLDEKLTRESLDAIVMSNNVNFRFKIVEEFQKLRFSTFCQAIDF